MGMLLMIGVDRTERSKRTKEITSRMVSGVAGLSLILVQRPFKETEVDQVSGASAR